MEQLQSIILEEVLDFLKKEGFEDLEKRFYQRLIKNDVCIVSEHSDEKLRFTFSVLNQKKHEINSALSLDCFSFNMFKDYYNLFYKYYELSRK